jgi:hypothetical protein
MGLGLLGELYHAFVVVRTNGQFGQPYCIVAGFSYKESWEESRFIGKCPIKGEKLVDDEDTSKMRQNYKSYRSMLRSFINFYKKRIRFETRVVICGSTMAFDRLFVDAYKFGFIDKYFQLPEYITNIASIPDIVYPKSEDYPFSDVLLYSESENEWHENMNRDPQKYKGKMPIYEFEVIDESYCKWFYKDWWPFCYESRRYSEKRYLPYYIVQ